MFQWKWVHAGGRINLQMMTLPPSNLTNRSYFLHKLKHTNEHNNDVRVSIIPQFLEPLVNMLEATRLCNIINDECSNGSSIISVRDRSEPLLTCIKLTVPAVSQIWFLMALPSTITVLVSNSTPIVGLESTENLFSLNRDSKLLLPTPLSKWEKPYHRSELF